MKVNKYIFIALLLSLIFSVGAVAAQENITFQQSKMDEVSPETLSVPSDETQEIKSVEDESSVSSAGDENEIFKVSEKNQLASNEPANFSVINKAINNAENGDTIYLNGSTYVYNRSSIYFEQKNLTIVGGYSLGDGKYATLDAKGLNSILSISTNYYFDYFYNTNWNYTVTLDSIIFANANIAISAACHLNINNCYFINNTQAISFQDSLEFMYYDYGFSYSDETYNLNVIDSYFINNTGRYYSIVDVTNSPKAYYNNMYNPNNYGKKTFRNCLFENNTSRDGGAISIEYGANIQNCTFIGNSATRYGGAIYHTQGTYYNARYRYVVTNVINNTNFINNRAVEGGAIYGDFINITGSKFIDNVANFYGGALNIKSFMTINITNNEFTNNYAPYYNSHSMFITSQLNSVNVDFRENIVKGDKTEIYFDKPVTGLYTYILDGTTVKFCEGDIKIYALVTDDEGNKISTREFRFLVGEEEFITRVINSVAEINYQATIEKDNGKVVSVNTTDYTNVYNGKLEIIPFSVVFDFEDFIGAMGTAVKVPVYVNDASGHPLEKTIIARYNGHEKQLVSYNGIAHVLISLPLEKTSFLLAVQCDNEVKNRTVYVMDPHGDEAIVIDMAESVNGYVGRTITVPINVHDGNGNGLIGDITVSYNDKSRTIPLIDGQADVLVSLPVYETSFYLTVSFKGTEKICTINVIDPISEIEASIDLPHNLTGSIGEGLIIPVTVVDQNGTPLTGDIIISYNDYEITRSLNTTGQYAIAISLPLHETSFELTVNYKGNVKSCLVDVIDPKKPTHIIINVNETFNGEPGKSITIPVSIVDQDGNPLSGVILIEYNDYEKNITLVEGKADIVIGLPLTESSFEVAITYNGHTETTQINVVDNNPHINSIINLPETKTENIGKTIVIPVHVTDEDGNHLQGDVVIYYNGRETTQTLINGHTNIIISSQLHPTSFEVAVAYKDKQSHCIVDVIDPNPVKPVITLPESESGHVGKTIVIPVKVFDENGKALQGEIGIYYGGQEFTETLSNGLADVAIVLPNAPTTFNLTVAYGETTKNCLITVKEASDIEESNDTTVVIEVEEDITGAIGKTIIIPISIHDGNGNPLNGQFLALYDNNERQVTLNNGKANFVLALPTNPTVFDFTILYGEIIKTTKIIVVDLNNPMGDLTDVTSNGTSVVIPFPKDATGNVTININGKDYNGTIINGTVIVNINDLPDGEYDAIVIYSGDGNYSYSEKIITVIIKDGGVVDSNHPLANITEAESNDDGTLVIPFPDDATGNVTVTINGKNYTGIIVDGKVVLDIKDLPAGNYTSIIYYSGDGNYTNSTKTIIIIKDDDAVSPDNPMGNTTHAQSNDDGSISIPFPSDASGNVVVNIDGKYYTGKVVDGRVVLDVGDLPIGNYDANVYYLGDGNYSASSRTMMFIIKETTTNNNQQNAPATPNVNKKASKITAKKKTFKASKKVKKYSITLKSGKTAIKKVKVTIKVGKKTYKAKTNAKGKATFKIKKLTKKGKYKAVIKFKGDKTYKAATKKVKITIK